MSNDSKTLFQKILSTNEVLAMLGVSHSCFYKTIVKKLEFCKPFKVGLRKNSYFLADVEAWIADRAAAAQEVAA